MIVAPLVAWFRRGTDDPQSPGYRFGIGRLSCDEVADAIARGDYPHDEPAAVPARTGPLPDELLDRIAADIAEEALDHIRFAYPAMLAAVAGKSASRSIRNVIRQAVKAHIDAADKGQTELLLQRHQDHRRMMARLATWRSGRRKTREGR